MFARVKHGLYKQRRVIVLTYRPTRQQRNRFILKFSTSIFIWLRLPVFRVIIYCCCHFANNSLTLMLQNSETRGSVNRPSTKMHHNEYRLQIFQSQIIAQKCIRVHQNDTDSQKVLVTAPKCIKKNERRF